MTIRIVGNPTQGATRIYSDGIEIKGVIKVEFEPMVAGDLVVAKLHFHSPIIEINTDKEDMPPDGK